MSCVSRFMQEKIERKCTKIVRMVILTMAIFGLMIHFYFPYSLEIFYGVLYIIKYL